MRRVVVGGMVLGVALLNNPASSQVSREETRERGTTTVREAPRDAKPAPQTSGAPSCVEPVQATEPAQKYDAERERREFEQAAARYVKLREFTQRLEARHRHELEKDFEEQVELFVRKQAFTKRLVAQRQRAPEEASETSTPRTPDLDVGTSQ
jgi:hypothetical protein